MDKELFEDFLWFTIVGLTEFPFLYSREMEKETFLRKPEVKSNFYKKKYLNKK